jgi:NhaA family Na+:H+ antiporter
MEAKSISYQLQSFLHKPIGFSYPTFICFANTAIVIGSDIVETLTQHYSIGIAMGLVGKPIGIAL